MNTCKNSIYSSCDYFKFFHPQDEIIWKEIKKLTKELQPLMDSYQKTHTNKILDDWVLQRFIQKGICENEIKVIFLAFLNFYNENDPNHIYYIELIYNRIIHISKVAKKKRQ